MIPTEDYYTWITAQYQSQGQRVVEYQCTDGRRWKVVGTCNQCGMCETTTTDVDLGVPIEFVNYRVNPQGQRDQYTRVIVWRKTPGLPGACEELNYHQRLDIPMTPDAFVDIPQCSLQGEWL
jgi:hypothetical protein